MTCLCRPLKFTEISFSEFGIFSTIAENFIGQRILKILLDPASASTKEGVDSHVLRINQQAVSLFPLCILMLDPSLYFHYNNYTRYLSFYHPYNINLSSIQLAHKPLSNNERVFHDLNIMSTCLHFDTVHFHLLRAHTV